MIVTAVIAEFNPLHKGHHTLLRTIYDKCVVILSSNFTQRGSPAITDKFIRADMAMKAGA
ncbi:MAG: nucleotidyltransferase family protein, partial [Synergistaceae bacterium]|nr:nucleotidyltransferase family protein [Synergistaceae bacterium]